MPNIHPVLTHFPIVLLTAALVLDSMAALLVRHDLERVAFWAQLAGTVGLAATIVTGLAAKGSLHMDGAALEAIQMHEQIALLVAVIASLLMFWRVSARLRLPERNRPIYLILSLLMVGLLWLGAWYGGKLVFGFGVGVGTS